MLTDLDEMCAAGVTHILDNRMECNDEQLVTLAAPHVRYLHNGQDDRGQAMPDVWFDRGVGFSLVALDTPGTAVLAHCHMGINRGPSMAYAIMLALGEDPVQALQLIRAARPIAAIAYSHDALAWWHRATGTPPAESEGQMLAIQRWHRDNWIDVRRIIRQVRREEAGLNH